MTLLYKLRQALRSVWRFFFPARPEPFNPDTLFGHDRLLPDSDLEELRLVMEWVRWGRHMEYFARECEKLLSAKSVFRVAGPFVKEDAGVNA